MYVLMMESFASDIIYLSILFQSSNEQLAINTNM